MPASSVAAARRTSPGLTPNVAAFSRSTSTSRVGSLTGSSTFRLVTPPIFSICAPRSLALSARICSLWPYTRTTTGPSVPESVTSLSAYSW